MPNITRHFHIIHMTDNLVELDAWYDDVFSVRRFMDHQFAEFLKRDASLVLIGDLCIEPMAPSFHSEGWDQVAIGRFFNRFGKRWHSVSWYVGGPEDIEEIYNGCVKGGIRAFSIEGAPLKPGEPLNGTHGIFTHPADTYTQLGFNVPSELGDPRMDNTNDPSWWANQHPLGMTRASHFTLAVHDKNQARDRYVDSLGATLLSEGEVPLNGTTSAFVSYGDLVVELAQPTDASSPVAKAMDNNQGLYSVTLQVRDLPAARQYLTSKGIAFDREDDTTLISDPSTTHGAIYGFTTGKIQNDNR